MDRWDILIIVVAAYLAVITLVRLMVARRNQLVDQVRNQIEQQANAKAELAAQAAKAAREEAERGAA